MRYKPVRTSSVEAYISEGIVMKSKNSILENLELRMIQLYNTIIDKITSKHGRIEWWRKYWKI